MSVISSEVLVIESVLFNLHSGLLNLVSNICVHFLLYFVYLVVYRFVNGSTHAHDRLGEGIVEVLFAFGVDVDCGPIVPNRWARIAFQDYLQRYFIHFIHRKIRMSFNLVPA